jgi:hypothetical protein
VLSFRLDLEVLYIGFFIKPVDRDEESVPSLRDRFDETRIIRVVPQGLSEAIYSFVDSAVKIDSNIARPEPLLKFLASNHLVRVFDQSCQHLKRLLLKLYFGA